MTFVLLLLSLYTSVFVVAQTGPGWQAVPFNPPALPLAVRSPYLNAWEAQGGGPPSVGSQWPLLWQGSVQGWYAAVQVDNVTYQVLGMANIGGTQPSVEKEAKFTATRTSFALTLGPMNLNMTFLSPIEPTDLVRQSIPFSYLCMNLTSNDGQAHDVQVYSDISAEWISGDNNAIASWTHTVDNNAIVLQTQLVTPMAFTEIINHAQDTTAYYSMSIVPGQSWQIGQDILLRGQFNLTGVLSNTSNDTFRGISNDWPVFAISVDLGSITTTTEPIVWAIGSIRDPVVQYVGSTGQTELRRSYYWSQYSSAIDVVESVLSDFPRAYNAAIDLDNQLASNASAISSQYADLVALSARQVFGSMDITLGVDGSGNWNQSDVKIFMKNFDPIGKSALVSSVDIMYSALPAFVTLDPSYIKYLLEPLFQYQESTLNNVQFAVHDLGAKYPNATGPDQNPTSLGIEESANMLIMTLAYSQLTADNSLIQEHYTLLKQWGDYLVGTALIPDDQVTTDNFTTVNQTSLAIKGIIGIKAMSGLSQFAGQSDDQSHYQNVSSTYYSQWKSLAISSDNTHVKGEYGSDSSGALMYNFFADKLLQLNLIESSLYQSQNSFYKQQQAGQNFGVPSDSSVDTARIDYQMFTAATATDAEARNSFIDLIHDFAASNQNSTPFTLEYTAATGLYSKGDGGRGLNSPGIGSMFSLLALNVPMKQTLSAPGGGGSGGSSTDNTSGGSSTNIGAIVGGVVGGLVALGAILALILFYRRRRQHEQLNATQFDARPVPFTGVSKDMILTPDMQYEPFGVPQLPPSSDRPNLQHQHSQGIHPYPDTQYTLMAASGNHANADASTSELSPPVSLGLTTGSRHQRNDSADSQPYLESISLYPATPSSDVGPSASQVNVRSRAATASDLTASDRTASTNSAQRSHGSTKSRGMIAKQSLVNEQLRSEVENLRREMERIREERIVVVDEAPPSYS